MIAVIVGLLMTFITVVLPMILCGLTVFYLVFVSYRAICEMCDCFGIDHNFTVFLPFYGFRTAKFNEILDSYEECPVEEKFMKIMRVGIYTTIPLFAFGIMCHYLYRLITAYRLLGFFMYHKLNWTSVLLFCLFPAMGDVLVAKELSKFAMKQA